MLQLHRAVGEYVTQTDPPLGEHLADEQPPMAFVRPPLAAEQGQAVLSAARSETIDCALKSRCLGHGPVESVTVGVVVLLTRGPPAQRLTEEDVAHLDLPQCRPERLPVELGREARARERADIDDGVDCLPFK